MVKKIYKKIYRKFSKTNDSWCNKYQLPQDWKTELPSKPFGSKGRRETKDSLHDRYPSGSNPVSHIYNSKYFSLL